MSRREEIDEGQDARGDVRTLNLAVGNIVNAIMDDADNRGLFKGIDPDIIDEIKDAWDGLVGPHLATPAPDAAKLSESATAILAGQKFNHPGGVEAGDDPHRLVGWRVPLSKVGLGTAILALEEIERAATRPIHDAGYARAIEDAAAWLDSRADQLAAFKNRLNPRSESLSERQNWLALDQGEDNYRADAASIRNLAPPVKPAAPASTDAKVRERAFAINREFGWVINHCTTGSREDAMRFATQEEAEKFVADRYWLQDSIKDYSLGTRWKTTIEDVSDLLRAPDLTAAGGEVSVPRNPSAEQVKEWRRLIDDPDSNVFDMIDIDDVANILDALTAERTAREKAEEAGRIIDKHGAEGWSLATQRLKALDAAQAEAKRLAGGVERLKEALIPFIAEAKRIFAVECADTISDNVQLWQSGGPELARTQITYGDLRRAALSQTATDAPSGAAQPVRECTSCKWKTLAEEQYGEIGQLDGEAEAERERASKIVQELRDAEPPGRSKLMLAIAERAIERGRNLTSAEKLENIDRFMREEEAGE